MVDKLGFVKTLEAVLAGVVAMSLLNFVQTYTSSRLSVAQRSPNTIINDFIDVMDLRAVVEEYDYLTLDSYFHNLFFETVYYYFEPTYFEKLTITSDHEVSWPNTSFIYHFPSGIDENSIGIISGGYEFPTKALFNWYQIPINFGESVVDEYISFETTIEDQGINNNSFRFFVKGKESLISVNSWNESPLSVNVSLTVYVPEIDSSEDCHIYYSKGGFINQTYPLLTPTKELTPVVYNIQESRTAEIIFSPDSISTSSTDYYLKYTLFSDYSDNYEDFELVNNSGITITVEDDSLKEGTSPYSTTIRGPNAVKRVIPLSSGFVELKVYGDFS